MRFSMLRAGSSRRNSGCARATGHCRDCSECAATTSRTRRRCARDRCGQHHLAIGHAVERVIADDKLFRRVRAADQCVVLISRPQQCAADEIDPLRNLRQCLGLRDEGVDLSGFAGRSEAIGRRQQRGAGNQPQQGSAGRRVLHPRYNSAFPIETDQPMSLPCSNRLQKQGTRRPMAQLLTGYLLGRRQDTSA